MSSATLTDFDLHLWNEGNQFRAYEKLGAHCSQENGVSGVHYAVWAPNAERVSVIGEFNGWRPHANELSPAGVSGIWQGFVPGCQNGTLYKYFLESRYQGYKVAKADPFGFAAEIRPQTASKVWGLGGYEWHDEEWLKYRRDSQNLHAPISIYEVHLGSWRRDSANRWLTYRELAHQLADYVHEMGFTHVELLPITEHPFDGSWGYQTVGYFAPTSRFGTPQDFMYLVDHLHQRGIGVILDWVPAHFPRDEHGLGYFDGTHLFEHADPNQGLHRDWGTFIFNFGRREVQSFLISNAIFWLEKYHIDGLRVDAVASMLYLDYSRKAGEWTPNQFGGRENLEAISFLKRLNEQVYAQFPDVMTIAEESTSWPAVSRPTYTGGLGFGYKWDMGWMHDTLEYTAHEPIHRKYHQNRLTFRQVYAFTENFVLPLSHDEVVHGKKSLLNKMPGDQWQKFANLRLLLAYMYALPGKKLLFMGSELAQEQEWNHDSQLQWNLLSDPLHRGLQRLVRDLNTIYRGQRALHSKDCEPAGFEWIDASDADASIISFLRKGWDEADDLIIAGNFTPETRHNYKIGAPRRGYWEEILNTDAQLYGGSGQGNLGGSETAPFPMHGRPYLINVTLQPLGVAMFRRRG